jgi:hypothetical protein
MKSLASILNLEQRSKLLLVSILLFFILPPFLEGNNIGEVALIGNLYLTLVFATLQLAAVRALFWSAAPIAATSIVLLLLSHYVPTKNLLIMNYLVLAVFLMLVSVSLFTYLGLDAGITSGHLHVSVSLYFLLGMTWFALYSLLNTLRPGSFAEGGVPMIRNPPASTMIYFSLSTLTTVGYGDIVAIKPPARMFATLEAASGVLYIAISVARLVASYQSGPPGKNG